MSSVLVTGGAGFVGANLIRDLLGEGDGRLLGGLASYLQNLEVDVITGSVTNSDSVLAAGEGVDAIAHLAAMSGVKPSIDEPQRGFDVNALDTSNALESARLLGIRTFVFASSGAVLAGAEPPLHEDIRSVPLSPYGASKAYGEFLVQAFSIAYGIVGDALRFSNVYVGYCSHKDSVIATFLRNAPFGKASDHLRRRRPDARLRARL